MERTTKHRILGILVVIGLVIILLPFFQGGKEAPTEVTVVKAPPFPDQSVQVTATDTADVSNTTATSNPTVAATTALAPQSQTTETNPTTAVTPAVDNAPPATIAKPASTPIKSASVVKTDLPSSNDPIKTDLTTAHDTAKQASLDPNNTSSNAILNEDVSPQAQNSEQVLVPDSDDEENITKTAKVASKKANQVASYKIIEDSKSKTKIKKTASLSKRNNLNSHKPVKAPSAQTASLTPAPFDNNGLFSLKNPVWVIQIGSFKNKTNALRLVNQLRSSGYRAFIQRTSTAFGESTRVFVGPEYKQVNARALATRLETDMHLKGIVVSYKPLTL